MSQPKESSLCTPGTPAEIYVWLVPSEHVQEQPGSWRIRKWDTAPFPEANYTLSASSEIAPQDGLTRVRAYLNQQYITGKPAADILDGLESILKQAAPSATAPTNSEMVELARKTLRRSTRLPVFEAHYLACEVLRLSGASTDGGGA